MQFEDRLRVSTPEGIELELVLAGLGSRAAAAVIDAAIRGVIYIAIYFVLGNVSETLELGGYAAAIFIPMVFLIEVGYDIAFETLSSGQTPGKRANGLRVLRTDGGPIDGRTSSVRNILRLIDGLGTLYIAGTVTVLATPKNQRLGDLAAGTVVVRDRTASFPSAHLIYREHPHLPRFADWDVSAVTHNEMGAVRRFLDRRGSLPTDHRTRIAAQLAGTLRRKVPGANEAMHPEAFLEALREAKQYRA